MLAALSYAVIYRSDPTHFTTILRCLTDRNLSYQIFRENNRRMHHSMLLLNIISSVLLGTFVSWGVFRLRLLDEFGLSTTALGWVFIGILIVFRFTTLNGLGLISKKQEIIDQVLHQFWIILASLGPAILLVTAFSAFGPHLSQTGFIWFGACLIGAGYLIFVARSLLIAMQEKGIGLLNLIYYFCALEIMPVLVAYRTLLS